MVGDPGGLWVRNLTITINRICQQNKGRNRPTRLGVAKGGWARLRREGKKQGKCCSVVGDKRSWTGRDGSGVERRRRMLKEKKVVTPEVGPTSRDDGGGKNKKDEV